MRQKVPGMHHDGFFCTSPDFESGAFPSPGVIGMKFAEIDTPVAVKYEPWWDAGARRVPDERSMSWLM